MVVPATRRPEKVGKVGAFRRWLLVAMTIPALWGPTGVETPLSESGFVGLSPVARRSKLALLQAGEIEAPPLSNKSSDLFVGRRYNAKVQKLQQFGAKLGLGVDKPGFLHISKVKPKGEFLANMSDAMALNDVIQVGFLKFFFLADVRCHQI